MASKTNSPQKGKLLKVSHATWAAVPSTASLVKRHSEHRSLEIREMEKCRELQFINAQPACTLHISRSKCSGAFLSHQRALGPTASTRHRTPQHPRPHRHASGDRPASQLAAEATTCSLSRQVRAAVVPASLFPVPWQQESTVGTGAVESATGIPGEKLGRRS